MSTNRWMLNKNVIHREIGTSIGQNGITKFAEKWAELENIILSEATQAQKDKHCNFSHLKCPASNVIYMYFEEMNVSRGLETRKGPMMRIKGL